MDNIDWVVIILFVYSSFIFFKHGRYIDDLKEEIAALEARSEASAKVMEDHAQIVTDNLMHQHLNLEIKMGVYDHSGRRRNRFWGTPFYDEYGDPSDLGCGENQYHPETPSNADS
jgi:hypothetical protein